jgi:hypothetical protein
MDGDGKLIDSGSIAPVNDQVVDIESVRHSLYLRAEQHSSSMSQRHSKIQTRTARSRLSQASTVVRLVRLSIFTGIRNLTKARYLGCKVSQ